MRVLALLLVGMIGVVAAGEAAKQTPEQKKAARIKELTREIAAAEVAVQHRTADLEKAVAAGKTELADSARGELEQYRKLIPAWKLELAWLKGEITIKTAEAKVKAAQEALDKAPDAEKPEKQKALDAAKKELEAVKALESKGEF